MPSRPCADIWQSSQTATDPTRTEDIEETTTVKLTRPELDDLLVDYLYDELEPARRAAFEEGLAEHPELAAEVAAHRRTRVAAAELPQLALPAGLLDGVLAEAGRVAAAQTAAAAAKRPGFFERLSRLLLQPAFASAALAVLVVGVGLLYVAQPNSGPNDPDRQRLGPVIASHPAEAAAEADQAPAVTVSAPTPPAAPEGLVVDEAKAKDEAELAAPEPSFKEPEMEKVASPSTQGLDAPAAQPNRAASAALEDKLDAGTPEEAEVGSKAHKGAARTVEVAARRVADTKAAPAADAAKRDLEPETGDQGFGAAGGGSAPGSPARGVSGGSPSTGDGTGGRFVPPPPERAPAKKDAATSTTGRPRPADAPPLAAKPAAEKALPEVPIAVPDEATRARIVHTTDRNADDASTAPAPAPVPTSERRTAAQPETASPAPPSRADEAAVPEDGDGSAAQREYLQRTGSTDGEAERQARRQEEERKKLEDAAVAELWKRYDRYLATERWSDADEVLDQLARIPSQAERVRALRPQLAKRKAAADAKRIEKEQTKQPAIDTYDYK